MTKCKNGTCLTLTELKKIANELKIKNIGKYQRNDNKKLLKKIQSHLKGKKQKGPTDKNKDVKGSNITSIMKQYEKIYPEFEFMGVFPINIKHSYNSLKNINFRKSKSKNKKLAVVWNTDVDTGPGEHWICLFINFERKTICYFDSLYESINSDINNTINELSRKNPEFKVYKNKKKFQKGDGNCGIFVIHFIVSQLEGDTCDNFFSSNNEINDKLMNAMRNIYFK